VFRVLLIRTTLNNMVLLKKVIEEHHSNKIQPKGIASIDREIVGRRYMTTFFNCQLRCSRFAGSAGKISLACEEAKMS
jgi:hypothetical protein